MRCGSPKACCNAIPSVTLHCSSLLPVLHSPASLTATDLQGEYQGKLNGHLKADDFFGTDKFPTAKLVFKTIAVKAANVYTVTADLTIKGISKPVTFDLATTANSATSTFKVNRTKYDITYSSGTLLTTLADKAIDDEFELTVALKF